MLPPLTLLQSFTTRTSTNTSKNRTRQRRNQSPKKRRRVLRSERESEALIAAELESAGILAPLDLAAIEEYNEENVEGVEEVLEEDDRWSVAGFEVESREEEKEEKEGERVKRPGRGKDRRGAGNEKGIKGMKSLKGMKGGKGWQWLRAHFPSHLHLQVWPPRTKTNDRNNRSITSITNFRAKRNHERATPRPRHSKTPTTSTNHCPLLHLPGELQNLIIHFLDPVSLALLRLSNHYFHTIIPPPPFIASGRHSPCLTNPHHPHRCQRFTFLCALYDKYNSNPTSTATSPSGPDSGSASDAHHHAVVTPGWEYHTTVCGQRFYPCGGCKAFHHIDWFAPVRGVVRRWPRLGDRPGAARSCVLHGWTEEDEEEEGRREMVVCAPEVWPAFAERVRGWVLRRVERCECCGRVREGVVSEKGEGMGKGGCECGCEVCGMVGIDCWEKGERRVSLYRK